MTNYYIPLGGIIIAAGMLLWIVSIALATQRDGMAYSDLSKWADTPMTFPTDSLVGPRVETQEASLQIANGGDRRLWIEWVESPVYFSLPFYPDEYTGEQNILEAKRGGRIQIDPGQYIFFPAKKTQLEGIRVSPLMGCDANEDRCQVGDEEVTPYFEFLFSPPESRGRDTALISAETGTTLPFNFSYFSQEDDAVTTMTCSLPSAECPDEFKVQNANKKFIGCGFSSPGYQNLLRQNCLVTQSPALHLVGTAMFDHEGNHHIYIAASPDNRFKLTFYDKGFEWI